MYVFSIMFMYISSFPFAAMFRSIQATEFVHSFRERFPVGQLTRFGPYAALAVTLSGTHKKIIKIRIQ